MKLLTDMEVSGKKVFLRADLDVDIKKAGESSRIKNLKPTIDYLLDHGAAKVIIAGHVGRPKGQDESLSLGNMVSQLEVALNRSLTFKADLKLDPPEVLADMSQLVLLENLRFWAGEEANDLEFAKKLAAFADMYVNDAFGVSHREHASIVAVAGLLEHAAGLNLQREIETLSRLIKSPKRPFVAIVGGAKIETKIPPIEFLSEVANTVLVGGQLPIEIAKEYKTFESRVWVAGLTSEKKDINDESIAKFKEAISDAQTVVWNGPLGLFEEGHIKGSEEIAKAIIDSGCYSVVGGGETCEFLESVGMLSKFSFVSSGGGAMLEFLSGKQLPGIKALV